MVTTGAMTKRIDRLERAGSSRAAAAPPTAKGGVVALSPRAAGLIDRAFTEHMHNERRLLDQLSPGEAEQLEALLTTWLARVEPPTDR